MLPLDAGLGVEGLPRSGTGQASLLTGVNGAALLGRHFGPWVPVALRALVEADNLLSRGVAAGLQVAFANAYPREFLEAPPRRWAAPPLAAQGAGLLVRHQEALAGGEAVASEIITAGWRSRWPEAGIPEVTPREAGATLARMARTHHLTLFAHYATDLAGHRGGMAGAREALERVDAFLGGIIEHLPPGALLLVVSDHGNIEDVASGHTRNPALGLAVWHPTSPPLAQALEEMASILDVPRTAGRWLGVELGPPPGPA